MAGLSLQNLFEKVMAIKKTFTFMTMLIFSVSILSACSKQHVTSGRNIPVPVISGTIVSIQPGNPSYATLKNVDVVESANSPEIKRLSGNTFKLPSGHFISKNHWQSDGDTLDLFIGDQLVDFTKVGKLSDEAPPQPDPQFDGIVQSINGNILVIQKVFMVFDQNMVFKGRKISNQIATIHVAPYTYVSLNGENKVDRSEIKVGDPVLLILIGPPNDYIATQMTDFHSLKASGWQLVNQ